MVVYVFILTCLYLKRHEYIFRATLTSVLNALLGEVTPKRLLQGGSPSGGKASGQRKRRRIRARGSVAPVEAPLPP